MSTADPSTADAPAPSDIASRLREASLVTLIGHASGDGLAATGLLGRALATIETPFHARLGRYGAQPTVGTEADLTVGLGRPDAETDVEIDESESVSAAAYEIAQELETADPGIAGAGVRAAGRTPAGELATALADAGIDRVPGLAVPVADATDGLAHSTLVHGPFSGDKAAARDCLSPDGDGRDRAARTVLSLVADETTQRGAEAVERILRPYSGGPLETLGGYGDVLDAAARHVPGVGLSVALGHTDPERLLDAWRAHALAVHDAVEAAECRRMEGMVIAEVENDADLASVARLLADFRAAEPVVLAIGPTGAIAHATASGLALDRVGAQAAETVGGRAVGTDRQVRIEVETTADLPTAFQEAMG